MVIFLVPWVEKGVGVFTDERKGTIIQGRYDVVCPPRTAWELHKAWPSSRLFMIPDAGHGGTVSI